MGRKMKKLTRAGAGALAGVMVFGLAAPLAPLSVEAADEVKNLAIGSTATVNDKETDYWGADKAVDGIVNRTAAKRDQSRWATNVGGDADAKRSGSHKEKLIANLSDHLPHSPYIRQYINVHNVLFLPLANEYFHLYEKYDLLLFLYRRLPMNYLRLSVKSGFYNR